MGYGENMLMWVLLGYIGVFIAVIGVAVVIYSYEFDHVGVAIGLAIGLILVGGTVAVYGLLINPDKQRAIGVEVEKQRKEDWAEELKSRYEKVTNQVNSGLNVTDSEIIEWKDQRTIVMKSGGKVYDVYVDSETYEVTEIIHSGEIMYDDGGN